LGQFLNIRSSSRKISKRKLIGERERQREKVVVHWNMAIAQLSLVFLFVFCGSILVSGVPIYPEWDSYGVAFHSHWLTNSIPDAYGTSWYLLTRNNGNEYHQTRWDISSTNGGTVTRKYYQFEIRNASNDQHIRSLTIYVVNPSTGSCSLYHHTNVPGHEPNSKCSTPVYWREVGIVNETNKIVDSVVFNTTCVKIDGEIWYEQEYFVKTSLFPVLTTVSIIGTNNQRARLEEQYWDFVPQGSKATGIFDLPISCNTKKREDGYEDMTKEKWFHTMKEMSGWVKPLRPYRV